MSQAAKIPIVLHHGLGGVGEFRIGPLSWKYFGGIDRALIDRGHPLIVTRVHPTAGIEVRARQLKEQILRQLEILGRPREQVVIVAHSMGGLDARFMIARLGMADRVLALLTITTPHRGSPYADWCARHLGRRLRGFQLMNRLGLDVQAMSDLTTESCRRFNEDIPDATGVKYFSISAARSWHLVPPFALHAWKVVHDAEGANDSLVSVTSSSWGALLGTWPADHWHSINKRFVVEVKEPTGDITPYYLSALDRVMASL